MSIVAIDLETAGLLFSDVTYEFCIAMSTGATVPTSGNTLTPATSGSEIYLLENPNVLEDSVFRVFVTADSTKEAKGIFSPIDGDIASQTSLNILQNSVENIGGGRLRIQTTLVDQVIAESGDNWVKVLVVVNDSLGVLFDPADIVDPGAGREYNGVGAKFADSDDDQVVMYKDNLGTALDTVGVCHHTPQANKPQILEREANGLYYFWMNSTATGNALPVGQLNSLFGFFDITQDAATYSPSGSFLIQDTDPSSHVHILFTIIVSEDTGTNERLDEIIIDIADHETARATMQSRTEGTGYDPNTSSLKNIKDTIG